MKYLNFLYKIQKFIDEIVDGEEERKYVKVILKMRTKAIYSLK